LTLVTDADFDFEVVKPPQSKSQVVEDPAKGRRPPRTAGSSALKAQQENSRPVRAVAEQLRLAPPAPVAVARMPFVMLILAMIIGGIVGLLLLNTQINQDAFKLQDLRQKQAQLETVEQQLNKELAQKQSPGSLAAGAARLGMVPAGVMPYITLPGGQASGVLQPTGQPRR
jgi:hypothetical protein